MLQERGFISIPVNNIQLARVRFRADCPQILGLFIDHQRLSVADIHIGGAVILQLHADLNFLVQLVDDLVALIEQIIGHLPLPVGDGALDIAIQCSDLLRIVIDRADASGDLIVESVGDVGQPLIDRLEAVHDKL